MFKRCGAAMLLWPLGMLAVGLVIVLVVPRFIPQRREPDYWLIVVPRWRVDEPEHGVPLAGWVIPEGVPTFRSPEACQRYLDKAIAAKRNMALNIWCMGDECGQCVNPALFRLPAKT